ncbi:hypothetical protein [Streptomyces sp. NPDC056491]|uniref:hypothetical protein n=1 Tax=unclassified Streptomyces TaxID=2593676 RepID=UPI0036CA1B2F
MALSEKCERSPPSFGLRNLHHADTRVIAIAPASTAGAGRPPITFSAIDKSQSESLIVDVRN